MVLQAHQFISANSHNPYYCNGPRVMLVLLTMDELLNLETDERLALCVSMISVWYARGSIRGSALILQRLDEKRKFKSTGLAKMFAGPRKFFRGPHVRHLCARILGLQRHIPLAELFFWSMQILDDACSGRVLAETENLCNFLSSRQNFMLLGRVLSVGRSEHS